MGQESSIPGRFSIVGNRGPELIESSAVLEVPTPESAVSLVETRGKVIEGKGSRRKVTIIEAGWGSSGYYSREILERDGPKAFAVGTHMYVDHPTGTEERERPERSIKDLAGKIIRQPWMEGNELVAEAEIFPHWQPLIEEMAPDIGLSIRATGNREPGEAEGDSGMIVKSIDEGYSVDYVTQAGAGGKIGELLECARQGNLGESRNAAHWFESRIHLDFTTHADRLFGDGHITRDERIGLSSAIGEALDAFSKSIESNVPGLLARDPYGEPDNQVINEDSKESESMKEKVEETVTKEEHDRLIAEAEKAKQEAQDKVDRAEDALMRMKADRIVRESGKLFEGLPSKAVDRVANSVLSDIPTNEDGKLDESALKGKVEEAVKSEREYLTEAGVGVSGFGPQSTNGNSSTPSEDFTENLVKEYMKDGMSESAARAAANGR